MLGEREHGDVSSCLTTASASLRSCGQHSTASLDGNVKGHTVMVWPLIVRWLVADACISISVSRGVRCRSVDGVDWLTGECRCAVCDGFGAFASAFGGFERGELRVRFATSARSLPPLFCECFVVAVVALRTRIRGLVVAVQLGRFSFSLFGRFTFSISRFG